MKLKTPKFVRKLANKYVSKKLTEELGFNVNIRLDECYLDNSDGKYRVRIEAEVEGNKKDIRNYIKSSLKG